MKRPLKQSRDRETDKPIGYFQITSEDVDEWATSRSLWMPTDQPFDELIQTLKTQGLRAFSQLEPKDFCWWYMDYHHRHCMTAIKPENKRSGMYACGRHMRAYKEAVAEEERRRQIDEEARIRSVIKERELREYQAAYDRLVREGWGPVLDRRPEAAKNWNKHVTRLYNTDVVIDLLVFLEMATGEKSEGGPSEAGYETISEELLRDV